MARAGPRMRWVSHSPASPAAEGTVVLEAVMEKNHFPTRLVWRDVGLCLHSAHGVVFKEGSGQHLCSVTENFRCWLRPQRLSLKRKSIFSLQFFTITTRKATH